MPSPNLHNILNLERRNFSLNTNADDGSNMFDENLEFTRPFDPILNIGRVSNPFMNDQHNPSEIEN